MFARNKARDIVHGAWSVQSVHGNQVLNFIRLEVPEIFLHPIRLELEDPGRFSQAEQFICFGIVKRQVFRVHQDSVGFEDVLYGILNDGQGFQPQKVHFQHSNLFNVLAIKLGDKQIRLL